MGYFFSNSIIKGWENISYLSWNSKGNDGGKGLVLTWKPRKQIDRWTWKMMKRLFSRNHLYSTHLIAGPTLSALLIELLTENGAGFKVQTAPLFVFCSMTSQFCYRSFARKEDTRTWDGVYLHLRPQLESLLCHHFVIKSSEGLEWILKLIFSSSQSMIIGI